MYYLSIHVLILFFDHHSRPHDHHVFLIFEWFDHYLYRNKNKKDDNSPF